MTTFSGVRKGSRGAVQGRYLIYIHDDPLMHNMAFLQ